MATKKIVFSKDYVMEIVISELRKRHSIPESYVTKVKDYGDDFLTFSELKVEENKEQE